MLHVAVALLRRPPARAPSFEA